MLGIPLVYAEINISVNFGVINGESVIGESHDY